MSPYVECVWQWDSVEVVKQHAPTKPEQAIDSTAQTASLAGGCVRGFWRLRTHIPCCMLFLVAPHSLRCGLSGSCAILRPGCCKSGRRRLRSQVRLSEHQHDLATEPQPRAASLQLQRVVAVASHALVACTIRLQLSAAICTYSAD
jgi:hypothetical protein